MDAARAYHDQVYDLAAAMFIESSPVPVKAAMAMQGRIENTVRSPLAPLSSAGNKYVKEAIAATAN